MKREEIIRDLVERSSGAGVGQYIAIRCDVVREIIAPLREQEAMIAVACDVLEIYAPDAACDEFSEDEKQREICSAECKNGLYTKCWERFLKWKLEKRRKPPEQMRDTKWEEADNGEK